MSTDHSSLIKKYRKVLRESWATGGAGGTEYAGSEDAIPGLYDEEEESIINPNQPKVALDWREVGLYEPRVPEEQKATQIALREIDGVFAKFKKDIESWQTKHTKLGAKDTVAREQLAQYVAKSVLGLTKLD